MSNYYATAALVASSGVTRDVNINTFAVAVDGAISSGQAADWADAIVGFYNELRADLMLKGRAQNDHLVKVLAADGSVPNYPLYEYPFNLSGAPGAVEMPPEVTLCVSYANTTEAGVPRARRRGRIYISGFGETANTVGRPDSGYCTNLRDAYKTYADAVNAISGLTAGVWSRVGATVYPIDLVWVDNEWDTMRSRGGRSTARYEATVTP